MPSGRIGRIGLALFQKKPKILYAAVENANFRQVSPEELKKIRKINGKIPEQIVGVQVYLTKNGGKSWKKVSPDGVDVSSKAAYSFTKMRVDPNDYKKIFVTGIVLANSTDGGKTWEDLDWPARRMFPKAFGDIRSFWIDPKDSNRMLMGSDGGIYASYDGGATSDFYDNLPMSQYYDISVDMQDPYNIYGGLQCHDSWKIPSLGWSGLVAKDDMVPVGGGDGMYNVVDHKDSRWLYNTSQFGGHYRVDQTLGIRKKIVPVAKKGKPIYRFNWTPPLLISPHNSKVIYAGSQMLLRSKDRGDHWEEISPDLTTNDAQKIDGKGHMWYCTITTMSESPVTAGIIWVGTDDGKVHVTQNHGETWTDLTRNLAMAGAPGPYWVSRVFASHHKAGTAFVAKTGIRRDDFRPFLLKTTNFGKTWTSIVSNLPQYSVNAIYEDHKNPNLLYLGNDLGAFFSMNGGKRWVRLKNNMPNVAVTDLLVHPRDNELVIATYGRGLFIADASALQQLKPSILKKSIHLFSVKPQIQRVAHTYGGKHRLFGSRNLELWNELNAVVVYYYLKEKVQQPPIITITGAKGKKLAQLKGGTHAGINRVFWDMRRHKKVKGKSKPVHRKRRSPMVNPGTYGVTLKFKGKTYKKWAKILKRKGWSTGPAKSVDHTP